MIINIKFHHYFLSLAVTYSFIYNGPSFVLCYLSCGDSIISEVCALDCREYRLPQMLILTLQDNTQVSVTWRSELRV